MINSLNLYLFISFQKFKYSFIINMINSIIRAGSFFTIYFFNLDEPLLLMTLTHLFIAIFACIISTVFVIKVIPKKREVKYQNINYNKEFLKIHINYGGNIISISLIGQLTNFITNLLYIFFDLIVFKTYITVCLATVNLVLNFSNNMDIKLSAVFAKTTVQTFNIACLANVLSSQKKFFAQTLLPGLNIQDNDVQRIVDS